MFAGPFCSYKPKEEPRSWHALAPSMDLSPFLALLPIALLSLVFFLSTGRKAHGDGRRSLPPSPLGFPLLGHLPLLGSLPHRTLRAMARTHGPVMLLRVGRVPIVVASSAAAAQEAMKARDVAFAGRYRGPMIDRLLYGCDMAFADYGEHWRQARRVCVLHLLSQRCVLSFRRVREQETAALLDRVRGADGTAAVNLSHLLLAYSSVVLLRAAFGDDSRYGLAGEGKTLRKLMVETGELLGWGTLGEVVPWLAWVDSLMGVHAKATRTFDALDSFLERGIAGHRARRHGGRREGDVDDDDDSRRSFVSVLLDAKEDEAGEILFDTVAIKAIILDMFLAGSDTTASTVEWAMAELINHPDDMHKLQEEIRTTIGGNNQVTEDHLGKLRRLKPVIKETLRLHMPSPLVLRETVEDTELLGYHVPACTRVIIDVGTIARDPATWERAEEFLPERWFGDDGRSVVAAAAGNDFTFLPFGGGRRGCPGAGFSMASVELLLTSLLYHFDWELPAGGASTVDMDEVGGLAVRFKNPLRLVAKAWSP